MKKTTAVIGGLGIGAGLMYFLDPDRGKRRRADIGNKVRHVVSKADDAVGKTARDLANRLTGIIAEAESALLPRDIPSNPVLVARVRTRLGRIVSHPGSIEVNASEGRVTLSGPVLATEVERLLDIVSSTKGVVGVENRLEVHEQAGTIPGLQGGRPTAAETCAFLQVNWSPASRLLAGAAGGALLVYGAKRRGILGSAVGPVGFALLSRAITNLELKRIVGLESGPRTIDIEKTINIEAPIEEVYKFWTEHERFPEFMSRVREVRRIGDRRYHWVVAGPAGVSVEWDADITRLVPNETIAFRSLPGSAVEQQGLVHFSSTADGDTCIDVKLSYNPPAGVIGHLIATLFGADPKKEMDEDLMRMKSFIETGQVPHDAVKKPVGVAAKQSGQ
jgi:uncharacterized membrane protein